MEVIIQGLYCSRHFSIQDIVVQFNGCMVNVLKCEVPLSATINYYNIAITKINPTEFTMIMTWYIYLPMFIKPVYRPTLYHTEDGSS